MTDPVRFGTETITRRDLFLAVRCVLATVLAAYLGLKEAEWLITEAIGLVGFVGFAILAYRDFSALSRSAGRS